MSMFTRRRFGAVALAGVLLAAASCGDDGGSAAPMKPKSDTTALTTTTVPPPVGRIARIVSLSPSATETLFDIGADDQVVAVDSFSNYPPEAPVTDLSAYEPNVEAIAAFEPDLVVTDGTNTQLLDQLNALGIATFVAPAPKTLAALFQQISQMGAATGNIAAAANLVSKLQGTVDAILKGYPDQPGQLSYYYELDNTYFTASSKTFIGSVFASLDMVNIADSVDNKKTAGYPQLTPEFIVQANPDVIFLADGKCCSQTAETVAARPGWSEIRAVKEGHVIVLDDDIASRWGPRIVDLLTTVADATRDIVPFFDPTALTNP